MPARHHPVGFMGWLARAPALPVTPICRAGYFFHAYSPVWLPSGGGGSGGSGGGDDVSPLRRKTRPTESKRRGTKTTVGQGVH